MHFPGRGNASTINTEEGKPLSSEGKRREKRRGRATLTLMVRCGAGGGGESDDFYDT